MRERAAATIRRVRGQESAARMAQLEAHVEDLEARLAEAETLHHRVAELTDVVSQLLVPLARREDEQVEAVLRQYVDELGS